MKIKLEKHKTEWNDSFKLEKEAIIKNLIPEKVFVEHIGSTSIPGLISKPIIDIMIGVEDENKLNNYINKIIHLGYVYVKNYEKIFPLRRYFFKLADENIDLPPIIDFSDDPEKYDSGSYKHKFHIHMVKLNSDFWKDHLLFRNYLLKNEDARLEYNQLKNKLVLTEWANINEYTKAKSFFIRKTLERALEYEF
ncbi:MAG TPA: GrpB family protein [Methanobacterium sp.]|jgi:GrpB-like predicted nucleotidyltransferase (UPF0157 family)|nr:GrpB family protein [Methanobacterium sp.]HOI39173.1 GrpB family protein [Methanobacterium sp.]